MNSADDDRIAARRAEAIRLRVSGKTIRAIAKELSISVSTAHADVRETMAEVAKAARDDAETELATDLERLDNALSIVLEVLNRGATAGTDDGDEPGDIFDGLTEQQELKLKAVDRLVKIQEQRAKLLGLYAPAKQEIAATATLAVNASPEAAARLVREQFGTHGSIAEADDAPDAG